MLAVTATGKDVIVQLPSRVTISSSEMDGVESFLGIQYAVAGEHFTLLLAPNESLQVTQFGPNCHQAYVGIPIPEWFYTQHNEDEECLYLNVWHPTKHHTRG
jgi:carboxylesterase type B